MNKFKDQLKKLVDDMRSEEVAAFDLWTWLPSYKVTEHYHGDYCSEFTPSVHDILFEATRYIAHLKSPEQELEQETKAWFNACCCGEDHE